MARNRAAEDRDTKRSRILDEATRLFLERGYAGTSMQALAHAAEITTTTIYWYFADKDALLIAVVEREIGAGVAPAGDGHATDLAGRLLAITEALERLDPLIVAVHARAALSPAVRAWHDQFHAAADAALTAEASAHLRALGRDDVLAETLAPIPRIWSYALEGMAAHGLPRDERRAICVTLVRQLEAL